MVVSDAPAGPCSEDEAAFHAQEGDGIAGSAIPAPHESAEENQVELPPLEDLVKRIPMPTRDLMEELFRAKFITVKRIPQSALK